VPGLLLSGPQLTRVRQVEAILVCQEFRRGWQLDFDEIVEIGAQVRGRCRCLLREHLQTERQGIVLILRQLAPANLRPHIIAPSSGDDRELLARELRLRRQGVLDGAELVERSLELGGQKLSDDAADGVERQTAACQLHLPRRRHDVRLVAGMHDQRFAVDVDDRLKQRRDEIDFTHGTARAGTDRTETSAPVCRREPS
jgi:hypothetical protein